MISLYRIIGFSLLVGSSTSAISLASLLNQNFREIGFLLAILIATGLGITGASIYYQRERMKDSIALYSIFLASLTITLLTGGLIQWVF